MSRARRVFVVRHGDRVDALYVRAFAACGEQSCARVCGERWRASMRLCPRVAAERRDAAERERASVIICTID